MGSKPDVFMPVFVGDYLRDTKRLSTEQHGAYFLLLLDQWVAGPIPDDDAVLARIVGLSLEAWRETRPALAHFFKIEDGHWSQGRALDERDKAERRVDKAKRAADTRWGTDQPKATRAERLKKAREMASHTPAQWEALQAFCGRSCVKCGRSRPLVKDHIKPVYKGGDDGIGNIQPLCVKCNSSKGPDETDYRRKGWREACEQIETMPAEMPAKRLLNACTSPSPSQEERGPLIAPLSSGDEGSSRAAQERAPTSTLQKANENVTPLIPPDVLQAFARDCGGEFVVSYLSRAGWNADDRVIIPATETAAKALRGASETLLRLSVGVGVVARKGG